MEQRLTEKVEERMKEILDEGINASNIENLYKLTKIKHLTKEDMCMNYGNYGTYGRRPGYDSYGRRGRDMRYRGEEELDRMSNEYGRYMESRSYGDGEETDKSFHFMIKSLENFIKVLHEEAETPQQRQMLQETLQRSMR